MTLGRTDVPARNAEGNILLHSELDGLDFEIYNDNRLRQAEVKVAGLDRVADGHFRGVVHIDADLNETVSVRVFNADRTKYAELGSGLVAAADFAPHIDIETYSVDIPTITWHDAVFYDLAVDRSGAGIVSNVDGVYLVDSTVSLSATPANRFEFVRWSGDIDGTAASMQQADVTMDQHRSVTALFGRVVPDEWVMNHFGNETIDLEDDPDDDGLSTRREFEAGTDPGRGDQSQSVSIDLEPGWNLISLPVQPSPSTMFQPNVSGTPSIAQWSWDAWQGRMTRQQPLAAKRAYWVFTTASDQEITVTGQQVIANSLFLFSGWNMIGPATARSVINDGEPATIVWTWDPLNKRFTRVNRDALLDPLRGYWLFSDSDTEI